MAWRAHRLLQGLAGGCALLLGATLISSCAAPQYSYITDSADSTYFKVPYGWKQVAPTDLCRELERDFNLKACPSVWTIAYGAAHQPTGREFLADNLSQPFLFAEVVPYTSQSGAPLTEQTLQDFFLPFSTAARASAAAFGFPLTKFQQLRADTMSVHGGFHGVREAYDYTFPDGHADTFDMDALTNSAGSTVYLLVVHCTTTCYRQYHTAIDAVMTSFTMRSH